MEEGRLLTPPSCAWIMLNTAARTFSIIGRVCRPRAETSVLPVRVTMLHWDASAKTLPTTTVTQRQRRATSATTCSAAGDDFQLAVQFPGGRRRLECSRA